jgi:hypothetical protein
MFEKPERIAVIIRCSERERRCRDCEDQQGDDKGFRLSRSQRLSLSLHPRCVAADRLIGGSSVWRRREERLHPEWLVGDTGIEPATPPV